MRGRPTKLTRAMIPVIARMVRTGVTWKQIAQWIGVHQSNLHEWRDKGGKARSGIYREFREAIDTVQLETLAKAEDVILQSAFEGATEVTMTKRETTGTDGKKVSVVYRHERHIPPSADMAMKWAERRFPEIYGRQVIAKHEGSIESRHTGAVSHDVSGVTLQMVFDDGEGEEGGTEDAGGGEAAADPERDRGDGTDGRPGDRSDGT